MFCVLRVLEILLQMNKRAGGLDQSLEKVIIRRVAMEPELLENVVRFVIFLIVPATKIGPVKRVSRDVFGLYVAGSVDLPDEL